MDHSQHGGHGGMGEDACSMNMLFTWSTKDLCIVFRSWHVRGTWSLLLSLAAVVVICAGYELVREASRRYEERLAIRHESHEPHEERRSLLWSGRTAGAEDEAGRVVKAMLYGVQVFYSFFIMLIFMTYQGHVMLAVMVGAILGYLMFGRSTISKSAACH